MHPVDWTTPRAIDWLFSALYTGFALLIVLGIWVLVNVLLVLVYLNALMGRADRGY